MVIREIIKYQHYYLNTSKSKWSIPYITTPK